MRIILITIFMLLIQSCSVFDSGIEWRDGKYVLLWIDSEENVSLSYEHEGSGYISVVPPQVITVGSNDKFIVIKQHPLPNSPDTVYFVVKKVQKLVEVDLKENVIGPLNEQEFNQIKTDQKLPNFSKRIGEKDEPWRLIFVIPMAAIILTIIPFFFAAWISTVIIIFQGFKEFPPSIFHSLKIEDLKLFFNLKKIIEAIKRDGWSLILVRTLGLSVAVHGFVILMVLAGTVLLVERILTLPFLN